jgi:PKHD-type hydroxylase
MFTNSHKTSHNPLNWYWFEKGFSEEEVNKIEEYAQQLPRLKGNVGNNESVAEERKSVVRWIYRNPDTEWLYAKMISMADTANENLWQFDMFSANEAIQYTEYYDDGGHYDWHIDMSAGFPLNQRKISMTVQLADGSDYEGGDFEVMRGRDVEKLPKGKGTVLIFPSYLLHRVAPVTGGVRKSLVLWLGGASFK